MATLFSASVNAPVCSVDWQHSKASIVSDFNQARSLVRKNMLSLPTFENTRLSLEERSETRLATVTPNRLAESYRPGLEQKKVD